MKFGQSDLLWLFDIWQLEFNKTLSIGLSLYKTLWTLWTLASRIFCDCLASGGLCSTRRWSRQIRTIYSYGRKAEWWMTECCPAIIRGVNVLRLDHIHQNDILCKHLWYIAIKTKFGNKEREDMTWPFDTWQRESMAKWKTSNKLSIIKYLVHIVFLPRDGAEI